MKKNPLLIAVLGASLCAALPHSAVAQYSEVMSWKVNLGPEMPGAEASSEVGSEERMDFVALNYDFSNGGGYVALTNATPIPDPVKELRFQVHTDNVTSVGVRLVDAQGEVFQYAIRDVPAGEWSDQRVKLSDDPETRFMVSEETGNEKIDYPIGGVWLIVQNIPDAGPQGKVKFRKIEVK